MELSILILFAILFYTATVLLMGLIVYFIPVILAYVRKHYDIVPIAILNIMFGWNFLGWIAALLWSLNSDTKKDD